MEQQANDNDVQLENTVEITSKSEELEKQVKTLVKVEVSPLRRTILNGVKTILPVIIEVKVDKIADKKEETETARPGFDLCIVLDRSGSMRGSKLENSKVAIENLIDNLIPEDTLSFVTYDSIVNVIFQPMKINEKDKMKEMVAAIADGGATDLCGGMDKGIEILKSIENTNPHSMKKLFLFSDGLVNAGIKDKDIIASHAKEAFQEFSISTSTFGVGDDFDEVIMKNIALSGEGIFHYISNIEEIPRQIAKGMRGLSTVVGYNTRLTLQGMNDTVVDSILNQDPSSLHAGVYLRELKEGDWKRVIAYLDVRPLNAGENDNREVESLRYSLTSTARKVINEEEISSEILIEGVLSLNFTNSHDLVVQEVENINVKSAITIIEVGKMDVEVAALIKKGNMDEARALKQEVVNKLEAIQSVDRISNTLYQNAKKNLASIKNKDVKKARKEADYGGYVARECDVGYCCD